MWRSLLNEITIQEVAILINPSKIKKTLFDIIDDMDKHAYLFSKRPGIDFSRRTKLPFGKMLSLIISMQGQSINKEL